SGALQAERRLARLSRHGDRCRRDRDLPTLAGKGMSEQGTYKPYAYYELMETSLRELLVEKGIITNEQVNAEVAAMRARTPERGARVVARAWVDAAYRKRLLANGTAGCEELGPEIPGLHPVVVENTPQVPNAIVCTLCSCHPRVLLGLPPAWSQLRNYRSAIALCT